MAPVDRPGGSEVVTEAGLTRSGREFGLKAARLRACPIDRRSISQLLQPFPLLRLDLLGRGHLLVEIDNQFPALVDFAHDE